MWGQHLKPGEWPTSVAGASGQCEPRLDALGLPPPLGPRPVSHLTTARCPPGWFLGQFTVYCLFLGLRHTDSSDCVCETRFDPQPFANCSYWPNWRLYLKSVPDNGRLAHCDDD